jgi:HK97 family phage major capsid protein
MDKDKVEVTRDELASLLKDVASSIVKEEVESQVKDFGATVDQKFAKFSATADLSGLDGKEKSAKFFKALYNKDLTTLASFKAMNETTGSAGAFLVPEEFTAEVYRIVEDFGLVAKMATKFPMGSDTRNIPTVASSVTGSYPGEATAGTASQPVLAQVQLISKTWVGLTAMSNELLEDANVSVVNLLVELFAEAIAGEIDSQALVGTGSPFTGILSNSSVTVVTTAVGKSTFSLVELSDYRDLIANVKPWSLQGAGFVMHRSVWSIIQKLRTGGTNSGDFFGASTNPVIVGVPQGFPSATAGFLWGYPVYLSDKMPTTTGVSTKFVIFGNLKHIYLGDRANLAVSISTEGVIGGVSLFETNQSAVRVIARHALAIGLPTAFAVLRTSAS